MARKNSGVITASIREPVPCPVRRWRLPSFGVSSRQRRTGQGQKESSQTPSPTDQNAKQHSQHWPKDPPKVRRPMLAGEEKGANRKLIIFPLELRAKTPALAGEPIKSSQANAGGEQANAACAQCAGNTQSMVCKAMSCSPSAAANVRVSSR